MDKYIDKECKTHGETRHRLDAKRGRYQCIKCVNAAVSNRRKEIKRLLVEYKGGKCEHCGYCKCIDAFDFHHVDPTTKEFGIAAHGNTRSLEKMKLEADKCILLCANCHRELHAEES